jgi:hypothetical protein
MKKSILKELIREILQEESKGLWANIRAKRERGAKPSHPNSKAFKDAVKAGKKISSMKENTIDFTSLEKELDNIFSKYDVDISFTTHFKERVLERGLTEEDIVELVHKVVDKYGEKVADLPKDQNVVFSDLSRLVDIAAVSGGFGADYLKDLIFKTAYKRFDKSEPEFKTNSSSPKLTVQEDIDDPVKPGILKDRLGKLSCTKVRAEKAKLKDKGTHYAKALQRYLNYHCK